MHRMCPCGDPRMGDVQMYRQTQMMMQMMQMMQLMQMMMGQQQGCCGQYSGFSDYDPAMRLDNAMGRIPNPAYAQDPYNYYPRAEPSPYGYRRPQSYQSDFSANSANPNAEIPNFGANPGKQQVGQMLDAAAQKYGVPPEILKAVAYKESSWSPQASSFDGGHGKGIMQIDDRSHAFARGDSVWDPVQNIDYGAKLLATLHERKGNWHDAIRAYNGSGPAAEKYAHSVTSLAQQQPWTRWGVSDNNYA